MLYDVTKVVRILLRGNTIYMVNSYHIHTICFFLHDDKHLLHYSSNSCKGCKKCISKIIF